MQLFEFVAVSADGSRINGRERAKNELMLDQSLEERGLVLTESNAVNEKQALAACSLKGDDLVAFTTQLSTVTGAGVPIIEGLQGIGERMHKPASRALVARMLEGLRAGDSLTKVMQPFGRTFPPAYQASVRAGEESGSLDSVLERMAKYLEWSRGMRATTIQALIYPGMLLLAIIGLILILLFHVLPSLVGLFPEGQTDLPWQTELVLSFSNGLRDNVVLIGISLLALLGLGMYARGQAKLRLLVAKAILAVPKLGAVLTKLAMSRFASTAATLHSAGCEVFTVLSVAADTCGNIAFREAFERAIQRVRSGSPISDALAKEPLIDPLLVQMISVGEKSGALERTLTKLCAYYDEDVPRSVKRFLSVIEPLMLVGSGVLVAFILMASVLPLFQLYETIG